MQTFLPYADFAKSMQVLDRRRLGNQVWREGITLLRGGWPHHPAAMMWAGHKDALAAYLWAGVQELLARGRDYRDRPWALEILSYDLSTKDMPFWLGDGPFHSSMRAALLAKDFEHYSRFGWDEEPAIDYLWPVMKGER